MMKSKYIFTKGGLAKVEVYDVPELGALLCRLPTALGIHLVREKDCVYDSRDLAVKHALSQLDKIPPPKEDDLYFYHFMEDGVDYRRIKKEDYLGLGHLDMGTPDGVAYGLMDYMLSKEVVIKKLEHDCKMD